MEYVKPFFEKRTIQAPRRNRNALFARPLPLETFPVPAFVPSNPVSYIQITYALLSTYWSSERSHGEPYTAYYSAATRSVHVADDVAVWALWQSGFFGKGSLSRSEPEWLEKERRRLATANGGAKHGGTAAEVTRKRREERNAGKRERARVQREELEDQLRSEGKLLEVKTDANGAASHENGVLRSPKGAAPEGNGHASTGDAGLKAAESVVKSDQKPEPTTTKSTRNQEHLQLTPHETLFLTYGLGVLKVYPEPASKAKPLSDPELLELFRRTSTFPPLPAPTAKQPLPPDDRFMLHYVVYHHFRSLGWVVRPGIKFAVDLLLYARGPVFAHAEFAVIVLPSYSRWPDSIGRASSKEQQAWREQGEWWWLHAANRVQNQVLKSLVLVYVEVPTAAELAEDGSTADIGRLLQRYSVREFVIKRWTPNRNRG